MIKTKDLGVAEPTPFWGTGESSKPVMKQHEEITKNPFPNIVMCAKKFSGKTVLAISLILKHFASNKTKIVIFSGDLTTDKENKNAFDPIIEQLGTVEIYKHFIDKDGNNVLLQKIDEADEMFLKENKHKFEFPRMIILFDDLQEYELRSPEMDNLFKSNRHHGILTILCCHNMTHITPTVRRNTDILYVFRGMGKQELEDIYKWFGPPMPIKDFERLYRKATTDSRFMMLDLNTKIMREGLGREIFID